MSIAFIFPYLIAFTWDCMVIYQDQVEVHNF